MTAPGRTKNIGRGRIGVSMRTFSFKTSYFDACCGNCIGGKQRALVTSDKRLPLLNSSCSGLDKSDCQSGSEVYLIEFDNRMNRNSVTLSLLQPSCITA